MNRLIVIAVALALSLGAAGCLEQLVSQSLAIIGLGETVTETAPVVAVFRPEFGVVAVIIGGLLIAAGKTLTLLRKET